MMMCQQRTTRSPLSAGGPSSFTLFLSLSFVCVCVYVVNIYITTTIRVPSFPLRSFPKGSRVQPKCGVKDTTKISNTSIGTLVCVCVCVSRFSLSLWFGGVVTFSSLLSFFGFLDVFFPPRAAFETSSKSRSLSLACCRGSLSTRTLFARREDRQTLFAQREREREFLAAEEEFSRERRDERDEMKKNETFCVGGVVYVE